MVLHRIIERRMPVSCCFDSRRWLNPDVKEDIQTHQIPLFDLAERSLERIIQEESISLMYMPVYDETPEYMDCIDTSRCQVLVTIHDLRKLELPLDSYQMLYKPWKRGLRYIVKRILSGYFKKRKLHEVQKVLDMEGMKIVTVSEHSSYAFKSYFPQYCNLDIPVFYSPSTSHVHTDSVKYHKKYFLLVSCNRYNKNNLRAIMAFDRLFTYGYAQGYKVKLTGISDLSVFYCTVKNPDRFECVGFVNDIELDQLFHDAYCFVYPTLNEGFGYPPLEAMHYGVPVLASSFSAVSEICGGAVIYFNPFSVEEIMNRILMILDEKKHWYYSQQGRERYRVVTQRQHEDLDRLIDYIYNYKP